MRAWATALVVFFSAGVLPATACMETRRSLGEDCLKDSDCVSGICSQLHCATPSPVIDAQVIAHGAAEDSDIDVLATSPDATAAPDAEVDGVAGDGASSDEGAIEPEGSSADAPTDGDGSGD
jgi:hypothetical protein